MKLKGKINSAISIIKAKMGKRIPVAVRFQLTSRCDHRCLYCNIWKTKEPEMSTGQVFSLLRELKEAGTQRISFSGGEPLLRDDIGEIIDYTKSLGISPSINSRGAGIEKKINEIKNLDLIKVSIDGPEEIHDFLSGKKGAFKQAIRLVEIAQKNGIKVTFATTLTRYNIEHLDFILELAKKYNTVVAFQPLKNLYHGVDSVENLYPEAEKYRKAIKNLIDLKIKGNKNMRNSLIGLKHIYHWPNYPKLNCAAGKLFCIIGTTGVLYPCDRIPYDEKLPNCLEIGFKEAFEKLPPVNCSGCGFCGSLELSFLLAFKFGTVSSVLQLVKNRRESKFTNSIHKLAGSFFNGMKFVLPWAITLAIFFILLKRISGEKVFQTFLQANPKPVFGALIISAFASLYVGVEKYRQILNLLGYSLSSDKIRALRVGSLPLKVVLPLKSGELIRAVYLKKEYNVPYQKGINSIILVYILRFLVLTVIILTGLAFYIRAPWLLLVFGFFVLAGSRFVKKIKSKTVSAVIFHSVLLELCLLFNFYVIFKAFDINIPFANFLVFVPLSMIAASLPVSIAGFGPREGLILLFFSGFAASEKLFASALTVSFVNGLFPAVVGLYFLHPFIMSLIFKRSEVTHSDEVKVIDSVKYLEKRQKNPITRYRIKKRAEKIMEAIKKYKNNSHISVLDIGSADGEILSILNSKLNLEKAVGIEPSDELRSANKDRNINILEGVGENLPFNEGEFDVVVIASAIEHVRDAGKVMLESRRVLKKEGLLVMTAVDPFFDEIATLSGIKPDDHYRTYNLKELKELFVKSKFQVKMAQKFGPLFYSLVVGEKAV